MLISGGTEPGEWSGVLLVTAPSWLGTPGEKFANRKRCARVTTIF
jgi:hypothetical protein